MGLRKKKVNGKEYYYLELSFLAGKTKKFSKYLGREKPPEKELVRIKSDFKSKIIERLSGQRYSSKLVSEDTVIKSLLFRDAFNKKFNSLSPTKKKKFEIDRTIIFTLTTLTTEDVDVSLKDVENAFSKRLNFSLREKISKNMLKAVESIKSNRIPTLSYLLELHKIIMANFESKNPGKLRAKQVYLHKRNEDNPLSIEIAFRPPEPKKIRFLLGEFFDWLVLSDLNPIEKAALAHYKIYVIHPFLDGNKRICRLFFNKTLLESGFPLINISEKREVYFEALIHSAEKQNPKELIDFCFKEFFRQTKQFLKS